ncbi:cytochrome P450 [Melanogaster broomeanus]|nr:cytochrome P450 [Melanogaster broomeanus]
MAFKLWRKKRGFPLPPGPTPLPFIGNAFSINSSKPWVTYAEWAARYGRFLLLFQFNSPAGLSSIFDRQETYFMIRVLNQDIIVLSSEKIVRDLLDGRSSVYSDRPYIATRDPFGWSFNFGAEAAVAFHPLQLHTARQLISDLLKSPGDYATHLQRFSAATIMSIVYDYEIAPDHDRLVELFERGNSLAMEGLTPETASVVAAFPFVLSLPEWFPGARIARKAAMSKQCAIEMISEPFEYARKREADGTAAPAMAIDLLRSMKGADDPSHLQLVKETCATARAETTTSTLHWFILAMLQNPEVQKRAQAEIDTVVGTDRLPHFDDRPSLPYVEAVFREILRMYPIGPLGIPHATTTDDIYEGHFIPKGSTIVVNIWAILHNEDTYPGPDVFKPERFFVDGELNDENPADGLVFGFGRRVCPGRYTADASVWVAIASILSALNISKALDEEGNEIDFSPKFTYGVTS